MIAAGALYQPSARRLPVSFDAFLLMLDQRTEHLRVRPRLAGVLLSAGTVAELVLSGHVRAHGDHLQVQDIPPPSCPHLTLAVEEVQREAALDPFLTLTDWLRYWAPASETLTASRMEDAGLVHVTSKRSHLPWKERIARYPTQDYRVTAWAPLRLGEPLAAGAMFGPHDTLLIALVAAVGLGPLLAPPTLLSAPQVPERIATVAASIAQWPELQAVTSAAAHVAQSAALLSH